MVYTVTELRSVWCVLKRKFHVVLKPLASLAADLPSHQSTSANDLISMHFPSRLLICFLPF